MPKMAEININVANVKEFAALYAAVGSLLNARAAAGPFTPVEHLRDAFENLVEAYDRIPIEVNNG